MARSGRCGAPIRGDSRSARARRSGGSRRASPTPARLRTALVGVAGRAARPGGPLLRHLPRPAGAGWTDAPAVGYTRKQQMADAVALLDRLGLDRVRLIGHDAGTILGSTLCPTHPERVHSFVATGSSSPVRAVPPAHAPGRLAAVVPTSDRHARPRPGGAPFRTPAAPALPVPAVHRLGLPSVGAGAGVATWWDVTLRRRTFACAGPTTARRHPVRLVGRSSTGRIRRLPTQRDAKGVSSCSADITWSKTCPRVGPSS